ncbi:hypothetical protein Taro_034870 [Colocasia esculenta]|uniref:Uncharacterized protein n=1 Tax=Colocasia esculenta TaxID=4460 RepID=A0A843W454_COLES|nr:hypothetical protein [Colocasia esculenta]
MPASFPHHLDWYASTVRSVSVKPDESESAAADRIIYSYETAFHGFAASLSEEGAALLEQQHGVSEAFMGVWANPISSHDVIIGVLDTGIWLESPNFSDAGMGPVLARWKGACEVGGDIASKHYNRKIVGARTFYRGYEASTGVIDEREKTPRDRDGHGTHTAATVAGSAMPNASLLGYAPETAREMAPAARVAAYKVCWPGGCFSSDILSAVDRAVADGVDVLSISLGGGVSSYYRDGMSVAAFGAMEAGVFVAYSVGNARPDPILAPSASPLLFTPAAIMCDLSCPAWSHQPPHATAPAPRTPAPTAVIARTPQGRPSFQVIRAHIKQRFSFQQEFVISALDNRHLLIRFQCKEDFLQLLLKESMLVQGRPFRFFQWSMDFNPDEDSPLVPVWLELPYLPANFFNDVMICSIAGSIGTVLQIDRNTKSMLRTQCARANVQLDVTKQIPDRVCVGCGAHGFWQPIVYPAPPLYCSSCRHLGHSPSQCKKTAAMPKQRHDGQKPGQSEGALPKRAENSDAPASGQVERKVWRPIIIGEKDSIPHCNQQVNQSKKGAVPTTAHQVLDVSSPQTSEGTAHTPAADEQSLLSLVDDTTVHLGALNVLGPAKTAVQEDTHPVLAETTVQKSELDEGQSQQPSATLSDPVNFVVHDTPTEINHQKPILSATKSDGDENTPRPQTSHTLNAAAKSSKWTTPPAEPPCDEGHPQQPPEVPLHISPVQTEPTNQQQASPSVTKSNEDEKTPRLQKFHTLNADVPALSFTISFIDTL